MRNIALKHKALAVLAALVALSALGGPSTTFAVGTTITPTPSGPIFFVRGTWSDSGATLKADVDESPSTTSILISDKSFLPKPGPEGDCATPEDCTIKVDSESMLIEQLIDGGYGNPTPPDTMVVQRGVNGSVANSHLSGRPIKAHTVSVSIYANNVTDTTGLGAFQVYMTLPPGLEIIKMTAQTTWLTSTYRSLWGCDSFHDENTRTWQVSCSTTGTTPLGPKGSGLIAKVILLPSEDIGLRTVSLAGQLVNISSTVIPSTSAPLKIRVLECPDANLDGDVDSGDIGQVARNMGDSGEDSGAALVSQVDASQTDMEVSDQSLLLQTNPLHDNCLELPCTISIDTEQMTLQALQEGTPDTMTVARPINAKLHNAGAHIYRPTVDGNHDGKMGYTDPRDVNDDGDVDSGDYGLIARTMVSECPAP
jgi:hypothetical protein